MLYCKKVSIENKNDSSALLFGYVRPESKVLDAGCACGDLSVKLKKLKNCRVYGWDYNPESIAVCRNRGIFESAEVVDLNEENQELYHSCKGFFDYIILGDVLEHLLHPDDVLEKMKGMLAEGGMLLISLPNVAHASVKANLLMDDFTYTEFGILDKTHLKFFTCRSITEFLSRHHLEIKELQTVLLPEDGYQPHRVSELPPAVYDFIMGDPHSLVMQYVFKCCPGSLPERKLREKNAAFFRLDKKVDAGLKKSDMLFKIKRILVTKFAGIIKYLERLR